MSLTHYEVQYLCKCPVYFTLCYSSATAAVTKQLDKVGVFHLFHYCSFFKKVVQVHRVFLQSAREKKHFSLSRKKGAEK